MTLKHAIRLASAWSQGHACTLRDGEAEEYHWIPIPEPPKGDDEN